MLQGVPAIRHNGKFRFEKAWMYHSSYADLVKLHWQTKTTLPERVTCMADEFGKWKKKKFGSIHI
jgi:hypothetical protein